MAVYRRGYTAMTMDWIVKKVSLHGYLFYFDCAVAESTHYYISVPSEVLGSATSIPAALK